MEVKWRGHHASEECHLRPEKGLGFRQMAKVVSKPEQPHTHQDQSRPNQWPLWSIPILPERRDRRYDGDPSVQQNEIIIELGHTIVRSVSPTNLRMLEHFGINPPTSP